MLALLRSIPLLCYLAFALTGYTAMATSKDISHSYILSLNADVAASARDSIVEALKKNGAKVSTREWGAAAREAGWSITTAARQTT
jgi:hypothetical protein